MKSVLGKLIQKEFGRSRYKIYCDKIEHKECMDIFCDIYYDLYRISEERLGSKLVELLKTVQLSVKISQIFLFVTLFFVLSVITILFTPMELSVKIIAVGAFILLYFYKFAEYIRNRYCDKDVRLVLIYKTALFHLLSEEGKE